MPQVLAPGDHLVLPTDADWNLVRAKAVTAVDVDGREYAAPRAQVAGVRAQMRRSIDWPAVLSADDFLFGAANLTFGFLILALGVFLLMWVIATG
jgi:hypothetical protein